MAAGALAGAFGYGVHWSNERHEVKRLHAVEQAREREAQWQIDVQALEEVKNDEIRRIAAARDAALRELRNRPERMPETSAASCAGSSGAELSRPDAEFLVGEAARADQLRADLEACRGWVEEVTR